MHDYRREIESGANDSLSIIAVDIPNGAEVLDVGTGTGALGRYLTHDKGCVVDGVTHNVSEAEQARPFYRRLEVADLEHHAVVDRFRSTSYDVIVCADVLEHLRNAVELLTNLRVLLKPGGVLFLSLPNATHMGVVLGLLAGRFVRTQEGLLDATHVHFLDRIGLKAWVEAAGYRISNEHAVRRNLVETEFRGIAYLAFPDSIRRYVECLPDADIYQFVWKLVPDFDASTAVVNFPLTPQIEVVPRYEVRLYFDRGNGFSEADSAVAFGLQDATLQKLVLEAPDLTGLVAVRLDFADRPCMSEFLGFAAEDEHGRAVWQWSGDWASSQIHSQCTWSSMPGRHGGRLVRSLGSDPSVTFPLCQADVEAAVRFVLHMSGPTPCVDDVSWQVQQTLERLLQTMAERESGWARLRKRVWRWLGAA